MKTISVKLQNTVCDSCACILVMMQALEQKICNHTNAYIFKHYIILKNELRYIAVQHYCFL